jgi:hypothetical protein
VLQGRPEAEAAYLRVGSSSMCRAVRITNGWTIMRSSCFALLASSAIAVEAQNMVLNPSFEDYTSCPTNFSQIDSVNGWEAIFGSPDYFNACADDTMTVPFNPLGYQWPSDGSGYAGLGFYDIGGKEYMQGRLIEPLQAGLLTFVSMRVSPGIGGDPAFASSPLVFANSIGLRFSTQPLGLQIAYGTLEFNTASLYLPAILSDSVNWTVLSTAFIPDSNYAYLQIGNFFADSLCQWFEADTIASGFPWAYAFVDMVCVSQQAGVCDPVSGIGEELFARAPSGIAFQDLLMLSLEVGGLEGAVEQAELFDARGRLVRSMVLQGATFLQWYLPELSNGLYVLELKLRDRPSVRIRSLKY